MNKNTALRIRQEIKDIERTTAIIKNIIDVDDSMSQSERDVILLRFNNFNIARVYFQDPIDAIIKEEDITRKQ